MNWLQKIAQSKFASPEGWLRSQGVSDDILQYALDNNKFPRKMQKWVALQLHKKFKSDPDIEMVNTPHDFDSNLIEVRDWFNHMSRTERGFDIMRYGLEEAYEAVYEWQDAMEDVRGEGHPRYYSQPATDGQDLGNGFYMVEVITDDLQNEGALMQHCVGDDTQDYIEQVESGRTKIFSLRDSGNNPHATIEVQNENEFDVDEFDNDPENWVHDEAGNLVDIDYEAAGDRQAQWGINQIQGKQNEPPVDKYRPFLKIWMESNPEFNPSKDDMLSVTSNPELLQMVLANPSDPFTYGKVSHFLDEEHMMGLMNTIIENPQAWSQTALEDALSKPIIKEWPIDREKHKNFTRQLTTHENGDMRRAAYSRMAADSYYRTAQGLEEFKQIALQETSAKVVAAILPNFFTYPNRGSTDSMERYRNPMFTPDLFPFAVELSERFKGAPEAGELHAKIIVGLTPQGDAQTIARAVTNRFAGQKLGEGSTYELRHALENMDSPRFGQVWSLLDPMLRKFMLAEETKGYNSRSFHSMVNKHREIIDQYPGETSMRSSNGGLAPPGHGTVYQPESAQGYQIPPSPDQQALDRLTDQGLNTHWGPPPGFPGREASWIGRMVSNIGGKYR